MQIEKMTETHKEVVLAMMRKFYASPAVYTNGSEEIFRRDVETCIQGSPYLEGFVFMEEDTVGGYAMVAHSFSTEFGRPCMWIEDLYLTPECRGKGMGGHFLTYLVLAYPDCVLRLEVEEENEGAVRLYKKCGFEVLPYVEMKK